MKKTALILTGLMIATANGQLIRHQVPSYEPPGVPHHDLIRYVGGQKVWVDDQKWVSFHGNVQRILDLPGPGTGAIVEGCYTNVNGNNFSGRFVLLNFPRALADGDVLECRSNYQALVIGTVKIGAATLHEVDYGTLKPVVTPAVIAPKARARPVTAKK